MGVALADGGRGILVDAELLSPTWPGWSARDDGHLLRPLDVVRRPDGHDVLFPVCRRLDRMLLDRSAAGERLPAGEAVTLAVSIVRGLREAGDLARLPGSWWLDEGGRPVLALGDGTADDDARTASRRCLELGGASASDPTWAAVFAELSRSRSSAREIRAVEEDLFAIAEPRPLSSPATAPRAMASVRSEGDMFTVADDRPPRALASWARFLDADLADMFSRWTTAMWRRARASQGSRRLPVVLAGAAGAGVLATGLLWPAAGAADPGETSRTATDAVTSGASEQLGSGSQEEQPTVDAGVRPADPDVALESLLGERLACAGDDACLASVLMDPASVIPPGAVDLPPVERTATLLDDLGGVAVYRLDADGRTPQLLVLALRDGEWLLRDVHDVPQQPGP